ncbi:ABC transporter permease [Rugamonas brunnea]|uniref:ABC transporter permease n=1 Tax=Rugamonas brunnea TaxID=2758569 RepID=UPI001C715ED4|nr:ABC transporter permease [Rugamonas brunnea]
MVRALDRKLLRDLAAMPGQAGTIALVVAAGVGAFVAQLSTYHSLVATRADYYQQARFADVFTDLKRAPTALLARVATLPGVAQADATVKFDVSIDLPDAREPLVGRMIGLDGAIQPQLNRLTLRSGRWPLPTEAGAVLVSEGFALARGLRPGSALTAVLNGHRQALQVVGVVLSPEYVFATLGGGLPDDRGFGVFWMERQQLASAFGMEGAFNHLNLKLAPGASAPATIDALDRLLTPYGGYGAIGRADQMSNRMLSQEIGQQRTMANVFPTIFLAVAAFLLHVVLSRQVAAQRPEIAALKAVGYADHVIALHFLKLACVIVLAGIVAGFALGAWLGHQMTGMYTEFFHFPALAFQIAPWIPIAAAVVSLVAGVGGTLTAVRAVVRLPPAEALRPPMPPRFGHGLFERSGLAQRLPPQARMIARTLQRNAVRSGITCIGVACSVAVILSGTFWRDSLDHLIDVQFHQAERGDVTLAFAEPAPGDVLAEVARLPGVLEAEPLRALPVRMRAGPRQYLGSVLGMPPDARLRRLLDAHQRPVPLPPEGILLGDRLASRLQVVAGDALAIEVLEGQRVQRTVPVAGIVNDMFGLTAYMDLAAMRRMLNEQDSVSAVVLNDRGGNPAALMAALKAMPRVATVSDKRAALATFERTSARNMLVFTSIITGFAVALTVGVVYNSARVSLAERAWELASLRVLGFTRAEVSGLLLGELAVQMAVAIPLGLWLGYLLSAALVHLMANETFALPLVIHARTYAYAAGATALAAVASALIVRLRVDRLDLIAVLKTRE